jgi:hypothetical protein
MVKPETEKVSDTEYLVYHNGKIYFVFKPLNTHAWQILYKGSYLVNCDTWYTALKYISGLSCTMKGRKR